ncbi:hypothetical protein KI387_000265, partial [Taxus chinensis]
METERKGVSRLISPPGEALKENIASDVTQLIGWTPLVEMKRIAQAEGAVARIVGKLEFYQPLCSVKDRIALRMIEDAEEKGLIFPGVTTLVEPTSGNTGIALACVAAQKGYKFIAIMPNTYSLERRMIMKCLGADICLTDSELGFSGVLNKVEELKATIPNFYMLDQLSNPANPDAHFQSTGPEIWQDTEGKVDIFVSGSGTGGTITGVGRYLKMKNPSIKVVCVEPSESPVISGGQKGSHKIQGMAPGFIPENLDMAVIDEIVAVSSDEAIMYARKIAREEGLLVGISSGAAFAAALKVGKRPENK